MLNLNHKIASRTIRVFLSSTFRDMGVERSHLINTVFRHLPALARERGVELTGVDLRWGFPRRSPRRARWRARPRASKFETFFMFALFSYTQQETT